MVLVIARIQVQYEEQQRHKEVVDRKDLGLRGVGPHERAGAQQVNDSNSNSNSDRVTCEYLKANRRAAMAPPINRDMPLTSSADTRRGSEGDDAAAAPMSNCSSGK